MSFHTSQYPIEDDRDSMILPGVRSSLSHGEPKARSLPSSRFSAILDLPPAMGLLPEVPIPTFVWGLSRARRFR